MENFYQYPQSPLLADRTTPHGPNWAADSPAGCGTIKNSFLHFKAEDQVETRGRVHSDMTDMAMANRRRVSNPHSDSPTLQYIAESHEESPLQVLEERRKSDVIVDVVGVVEALIPKYEPKVVYQSGVYPLDNHGNPFGFLVPEGYTMIPTALYNELRGARKDIQEVKILKKKEKKKKQPRVDTEAYTTMMLRNIPNKIDKAMLLRYFYSMGFHRTFDFFYLPMDFANMANVGYAFINFVSPMDAKRFQMAFHQHKIELAGYNHSTKVCEVNHARVQGLDANIAHYRNSPVMSLENDDWKPLLLQNGEPRPFPPPSAPLPSIRFRAARNSTLGRSHGGPKRYSRGPTGK